MSKHLVKVTRSPGRRAAPEAVDVAATKSGTNTFVSFRYASAEISVRGGKAHVSARRARWEDGKLSSEAFEGELDPSVYERAVEQAQRHFIGQTALLMQSLTSFLPFAGKRSRDRD
jgi:hypothetical protein